MRLSGVCALSFLAACTSPTAVSSAWNDAHYAAALALLQSCSGDATLGPLLLTPGRDRYEIATHQIQTCLNAANGCGAVETCFGLVVTQDPTCQPGCDGDSAITCRTNFRSTLNCARFGATCVAGACVDPPGSVTPDGALTCEDSVTPTCLDGATWHVCGASVACDSRLSGSTCSGGQCILGTACSPGKFLDGLACAGKALRVCVAGRIEQVDCTALGFTGCDPFTRGCSPNPLLAP